MSSGRDIGEVVRGVGRVEGATVCWMLWCFLVHTEDGHEIEICGGCHSIGFG